MIPRWTTARAVSCGADLRLSEAEPDCVPSKVKTGRVVTSERIEGKNRRLWRRKELAKWRPFGGNREEKEMEEEKESDEGEGIAAIVGTK